MTRDEFIEKAKLKHGDKYDYSLVEYKNNKTKVCIICSTHGEFWQNPKNHLGGKGCPKCANRSVTTEYFIEKAKLIHGDKYDYSLVKYINSTSKVIIICHEHGKFLQKPVYHLGGCDCQKCAKLIGPRKKTKTTEFFIEKSKLVHGNRYDYSKTLYVNNRSNVIIICPEHGEFSQKANSHTNGQGCAKCVGQYMDTEYFIEKAGNKHNFKYDYSKVEYNRTDIEVCITCPEHGEFWQTPNNHLYGFGCPKCSGSHMDLDYFIQKSNKKHHNKYDYSKVVYVKTDVKVCIVCSKHGEFWQTPHCHIRGQGCPTCKESEGEKTIRRILLNNEVSFDCNYRFNDCKHKKKLPFDFYIPKYNICVEYDGLQHYEPIEFFGGTKGFDELKKRDKIKTQYCIDNNIKLIRIPYTEFDNIEEVLKKELKL